MDAQRALLDELMGRNRNGDRPGQDVRDFRDARVCRFFLCGLCPHDLFQNTKMDLGECPRLHAPALQQAYARVSPDAAYETELERELVRIVADADRKIARAQARLEDQPGPSLLLDVDTAPDVLATTREIQRVLDEAEQAGLDGEVDASLALVASLDALLAKRAEAQAQTLVRRFRPVEVENDDKDDKDGKPVGPTQKLRVCDVCGAFLSIFDSDRRLADHFGGKLHLGFVQIRKKIAQLASERRERRGAHEASAGDPPRRDRHSRSRSRARREDRSSRRDRGRDRDSSRRHRRPRSPSRSRSRGRRR